MIIGKRKKIFKCTIILTFFCTFVILLFIKTLNFRIVEKEGVFTIFILILSTAILLFLSPAKKLYGMNIVGTDMICGNELLDYLMILVCTLLSVQIMFALLFFPATVTQSSMYPNFKENEKIIIINGNEDLERFDVVVFRADKDLLNLSSFDVDGDLWIKRIIGLPGEKIYYLNGYLYVNNEQVREEYLMENNSFKSGNFINNKGIFCKYNCYTNNFSTMSLTPDGIIPEGYYLLLGDNRSGSPYSHDSREIGLVPISLIIGEGKYKINGLFDWIKIGE